MSVPQNSKLSERIGFLATLLPVNLTTTASAATSAYVDVLGEVQTSTTTNGTAGLAANFGRYIATFQTGDNGTGSVTFSILKATDTSGTSSAAVYTAAYAATNADNVIVPIDLNQIFVDTTKHYYALSASIDSGACLVSGLLQGGDGRFEPASNYNVSSTKTPANVP